jgi:hypothetical protein
MLALAPLLLLVLGLQVYCLIDIVRSSSVRYLPKLVWAVIVVVVSAPLGAFAYLIWGRNRDDRQASGLDAEELADLTGSGGRPGSFDRP